MPEQPFSAPELSYVIPAHNSADLIEKTIAELAKRFTSTAVEVIIVENGSLDGTYELARALEEQWNNTLVSLVVLQSPKGYGNALRAGIAASRGSRVVLTADDLPFGFDDIDEAQKLGLPENTVIIGSKAHRQSQVDRGWQRVMLTGGFKFWRRIVLGMRVGDPQGTFIVEGSWIRPLLPALREEGFLLSTEIAYAASYSGIKIVEVPVRLRRGDHGTRVKLKDVYQMLVGLFNLRRRRKEYVGDRQRSTVQVS